MRPISPLLLAVAVAVGMANVRAEPPPQQLPQERGLMERINRPDMTLAFHPADKRFGGSSGAGLGQKTATTRSFVFRNRAALKTYNAKDFAGSRGFGTDNFSGRDRAAAVNAAAGADRAFGTRDVAVNEARDARKALPVRAARVPTFTPVGKRQDALDEQQRTRPMTIDEVRELLNKSK